MKVGLVILCRYSSSRLRGKILKEIEGKKVLEYLLEKVRRIENVSGFCIATSVEKDDDLIADFCQKNQVTIYRGDLNNVAERFYNCALENDYDAIVRVNGDNIFLDGEMIENAVYVFKKENLDFLSNVKERTYPKGMSIEIVKRNVYKAALNSINASEYYKEHVMPYFYDNDKAYKTKYLYHENDAYKNIDLALDTIEDFNLVSKMIRSFTKPHYEYSCKEVVELYKKC